MTARTDFSVIDMPVPQCFSRNATGLRSGANTHLRRSLDMVATRRKRVDFILGQFVFRSARITTGEWAEIICVVLEALTLGYLVGFRSLRQILTKGELLEVDGAVLKAGLGEHDLHHNAVFRNIMALRPFPEKPPTRKRVGKYGLSWRQRTSFRTIHLLLDRSGALWLLTTLWRPVLVRENDSREDDYKYVTARVELGFVTDRLLKQLLAHPVKMRPGGMRFGEKIVFELYLAQAETSDELKNRARHARIRARKIAGIVNRLGRGITRGEDD